MIDIPTLLAVLGALVAAVGGIGAFFRSRADRDNVIVDSAETVVQMLSTQLAQMDARLATVEGTVMSWESWADRVLTLLDRTIRMLDAAHRAEIQQLAEDARQDRPTRHARPVVPPLKTKPEKKPD